MKINGLVFHHKTGSLKQNFCMFELIYNKSYIFYITAYHVANHGVQDFLSFKQPLVSNVLAYNMKISFILMKVA